MWPFTTRQERQAAEMAQILAENSYERKMAGWVRTSVALLGGIVGTFAVLILMDELGTSPLQAWEYLKGRF